MDVGRLLGLCQQLTWLCKISAQDADRIDVDASVVEADLWLKISSELRRGIQDSKGSDGGGESGGKHLTMDLSRDGQRRKRAILWLVNTPSFTAA